MNYATNNDGTGMLRMTAAENERFQRGEEIVIRNGDCHGTFTIRAKLSRPRTRAKRYPLDIYGAGYKSPKHVPALTERRLLILPQFESDRTSKMRAAAERILSEYDFGLDTFEGSNGWEYGGVGSPDTIVCTIFLQLEGEIETTRYRFNVNFEDFDNPHVRVYKGG